MNKGEDKARIKMDVYNSAIFGGLWCLTPLSTMLQVYRGGGGN
jgi:hypothetical protein